MKNFTLTKHFLLTLLMLAFTGALHAQEIGVRGNNTIIADNDLTPSTADFTDFQTNLSRIFTIDNIQNSGNTTLTITSITLSNTTNFTISSPLADFTIAKNQTPEPFTITFNNPGPGTYTSTVTIASSNAGNDGADNVWIYTIQATGWAPEPEINIQGNATNIGHLDATPTTADGTDFGSTDIALGVPNTFTIQNLNTATGPLSVGAISFTGANPGDFALTIPPASSVAIGSSTTFEVTFTPSAGGIRNATINIISGVISISWL